MSFPQIDLPVFTTVLPSKNESIMFRPFTVKEEKILLIAEMSTEPAEIVLAVKQILSNCIVSESIDIDELALFDLEYLFVQIRSKSIGNIIKFSIEDSEDGEIHEVEVDLDLVKVEIPENHTSTVSINDTTFMQIRYPVVNELVDLMSFDKNDPNSVTKYIANHIEKIYDEDKVYDLKEESEASICAWLDTLGRSTMIEIEKFWDTMPVLRHVVKYKNNLGNDREIVLEGLQDFFL
jgi:hypothetical protein